jgi:hypothetical protein
MSLVKNRTVLGEEYKRGILWGGMSEKLNNEVH